MRDNIERFGSLDFRAIRLAVSGLLRRRHLREFLESSAL
jgi:hypothetical protein